jgi:hypothetical protein
MSKREDLFCQEKQEIIVANTVKCFAMLIYTMNNSKITKKSCQDEEFVKTIIRCETHLVKGLFDIISTLRRLS